MGIILNFMAAIFLLLLLFAAQLYPGSPIFWVASTAMAFTVLRYALVSILFWLIVRPPKSKWLRVPLGIAALTLAGWLIGSMNASSIGILDFLAFSTSATAVLTTLLESKPQEEEFKSLRFVSALLSWVWDRARLTYYWAQQFVWLTLTDIDLSLEEYYRHISSERAHSYTRTARYAPHGHTFAR